MSESTTLRVEVWRGGEQGKYETFQVPRRANQTVLDIVTHIQHHQDSTLSYRFACRVGMCGSCAMQVNGVARWTCRTHVSKVCTDGRLQLAPLSNLPIVKDLVVNMDPFFEKMQAAHGRFVGERTRHDPVAPVKPDSPERQEAEAGIECIGCGVCYSSCDVVSWRPDYLGPAALNRAWTLVNDLRDIDFLRLSAVAGDAGCHSCHTQGSCTQHCPKQISPTGSIAGLKRTTARAAMRGELGAETTRRR
ncbi:succinate dehydrogenase/fumarate reductase iron-sulfur subunit [Alcaligenaceae bacterium]|nr:succinate dehydrogenase/fumarate reductase iron-sulfur subunit [Alcaligenaceae bacterium]